MSSLLCLPRLMSVARSWFRSVFSYFVILFNVLRSSFLLSLVPFFMFCIYLIRSCFFSSVRLYFFRSLCSSWFLCWVRYGYTCFSFVRYFVRQVFMPSVASWFLSVVRSFVRYLFRVFFIDFGRSSLLSYEIYIYIYI